MNLLAHHRDHATVLLDGDIEWPLVHDVVRAIEDAVDYYHYAFIELRVRSLGGSNEALGYLLERLAAWREQGVHFRIRALGRTSSSAALLVALGDERVAEPGATLRFHGASIYRNGDVNAEVAAALRDKLTRADDRMVQRLVDRVLEGPHVPGEAGAQATDREVLEGLCMGARPDPGGTAPARLQVLADAIGTTVDTAIAARDRKSLAHIYGSLFQLDRPISPKLAATLGLLDRAAARAGPPSRAHVRGASGPTSSIPFASPTGELARETLTRHVLVLGDDATSATKLCLAPLVAALAQAPEGEVGPVLVLDPSAELRALIQTLAPDRVLDLRPDSLVLDLMSGSRELACALERGRWIRAAALIIERTLALVPGSPARVLVDTSGQVVEPVIREGLSLAVSAVGFMLMLLSAPPHRLDEWLSDDEPDEWPFAELIALARGAEGERGPNVLSLASWLLGTVPGLLPARTAKAAWERFGKPGSEEREVHRGLTDGGPILSGAGDHAHAVLAAAQATLSPFAAPGVRTSLYFGCEPGAKQADALDLAAMVSGSARARFVVHVPRDNSTGSLLATALKTCFFEAVLDDPERAPAGDTVPLCGYVARDFERYASAVDRRFLDAAQRARAFAVLASRSVSAIEVELPDIPGGEALVAHVWSGGGTKLLLRSTVPRTQELARGLASIRPGLPHVLNARPLSGLGPDECYLSAPDGRFERRQLLPWTEAPSEGDGTAPGSKVVALGLARSPEPVGEPT